MALGFTDTMKNARGLSLRDRIDGAATAGKLILYDGTRPATGAAAPNPALATIALQDPCGTVSAAGVITITPPSTPTQVSNTGAPTWARFTDGDDVPLIDCDAGTVGTDVILDQATIYQGAFVALVSATITEAG